MTGVRPTTPVTCVLVVVGMIRGVSLIVVALLSTCTSVRSNTACPPWLPTKRTVVPPAFVVRPNRSAFPKALGRALRDWKLSTTSPGPALMTLDVAGVVSEVFVSTGAQATSAIQETNSARRMAIGQFMS